MIQKNKHTSEINSLREQIDKELLAITNRKNVPLFYDPIYYTNKLKGKRLRPLLVILCGLTLNGKLESLLFPATAIELLHNFTLVHDDIMDNDELRRGNETVHVKWDVGTAILAGDGLLGLAYKKLLETKEKSIGTMARLFTNALIDICEGQALDKTFESAKSVSESQYLEMIRKKTAVLIQLACQLGALTANASEDEVKNFADFGYNIGMGFQIQDDLLDIFADESELGKKVGSDLTMNKKTILTTKLADLGKAPNSLSDLRVFKNQLISEAIDEEVSKMVESYFTKAYNLLKKIPDSHHKDTLRYLTDIIKNRDK